MSFSPPIVLIVALLAGLGLLAGCAAALDARATARETQWEARNPPVGRMLTVEGRQVHLVEAGRAPGTAPDLVLIHGANSNVRDFTFDLMARLDISKASVSMNMRTLEHMGMVRQVWLRGRSGRRKYYEAETDFLQVITNILNGREMRDVERALAVMEDNAQRLSEAMPNLSEKDRRLANLYMDRITQIQALFRFAQLVITSILAQVSSMDLGDVSRVELE